MGIRLCIDIVRHVGKHTIQQYYMYVITVLLVYSIVTPWRHHKVSPLGSDLYFPNVVEL